MAGGAQFAVKLKEAALKYYGDVGREWVRLLVTDRREYAEMLKEDIRKFEQAHMPPDAVPEVGRVVHRFGIIAAAGELATLFDLTGWNKGEATWGAATCLEAWLANRGGAKQGHDAKQMLRQVRLFIERNQASGFRHVSGTPLTGGGTYRVVGYYDCTDDSTIYYLQTEIFRHDVCKGFDHLQVLRALDESGYLVHNSNRLDYQITIASKHRQRFYAIKDSLLTSDDGVVD
jgi:putative DNA primase/helicase